MSIYEVVNNCTANKIAVSKERADVIEYSNCFIDKQDIYDKKLFSCSYFNFDTLKLIFTYNNQVRNSPVNSRFVVAFIWSLIYISSITKSLFKLTYREYNLRKADFD